jgi:hypothetical protein
MPSHVSNEIVYIKNPGSNYWHKVWSIVNSQNSKSQQKENLKNLEKWR